MASELAAALAKVQAELPSITKGEKATIPGKEGRAGYTYEYAGLDAVSAAILPLLGKNGLAFTAWPTLDDGRFVLSYSLLHASGEERTGTYPLPASGRPQDIGGVITYARRYALCAVTGAAPGGDDNDAAGSQEVHMDRPQRRGPERYSGSDRPRDNGSRVKVPVPGPEHERLRQEQPASSLWDGEDHWVDQPAGSFDVAAVTPEDKPGSIDARQRSGIMAALAALGIKDRQKRLNMLSDITGRTVESTNDLSFAEATNVEADLKGRKEAKEAVEAAQ